MKIGKVLIALMLVALLATPALADGPREHVCFGGSTLVRAEETVESVVLFGCGARIQSGARVLRDVVAFGGDVVLEENARVGKDVVVFGGSARIVGQITGDVVVFGGSVTLEPTAVIGNNGIVVGGFIDKKEGAVVRGEIKRSVGINRPGVQWHWGIPMSAPFRNGWDWFSLLVGWFVRGLVYTLALVALGALILVFLPTQLNQVAGVAEQSAVPSIGVGCLTWLVVPPLIILFAITCLGIPLSFVLGIVFVAAVMLGWIAISVVIGDKLLNALKVKNSVPILAMVVGLIVLWLVTSLPFLGMLIGLFATALALGAVALTRFGTRAYPPPAPVPVAPVVPALPVASTPPAAPSTPAPADEAGEKI